MGLASVAGIWLECPLSLHFRSGDSPAKEPDVSKIFRLKDELCMLANGFSECQCAGDCVRVGVLTFSHRFRQSIPNRHARLVSPQSFPQLWKKLWKFHEIGEPT